MADGDATDVEQTLHIARSVSVYRIPPRPGTTGWCSGEWLVSDKLFSGRMRIVAKGELCEIKLEDPQSGELFAICPVHYGHRSVCVEPVTDSSRYYVVRVEDSATRRHAFLGMGFDNRNDAFDFNEALVRHEQHVARERAAQARVLAAAAAAGPGSGSGTSAAAAGAATTSSTSSGPAQYWAPSAAAANSSAAAEVEGLYRQTAGLRLQEGQTIRVNVSGLKKPGTSAGTAAGGFLSAHGSAVSSCGPSAVAPGAIPPPPLPSRSGSPASSKALSPPPGPQPLWNHGLGRVSPQQGDAPLRLDGSADSTDKASVLCASGIAALAAGINETTKGQDNWATFD